VIVEEEKRDEQMRCYLLMMKGAPEILIKKCSKIATSDGVVALDDVMMQKFHVFFFPSIPHIINT
jgi:magnesium-transporting ATPase (P-type)